MAEARTLLLTGASGVGKSTALRTVAAALSAPSRGFVSAEIRGARGRREGFRLETLDGRTATLAHIDLGGPFRLGKYGVDVAALERIVAAALAPGAPLYLVDEIGPMECLSERFVDAMRPLLDSDVTVVATIHRRAGGFVQETRERRDIELWEVTPANRDQIPERVLEWIRDP